MRNFSRFLQHAEKGLRQTRHSWQKAHSPDGAWRQLLLSASSLGLPARLPLPGSEQPFPREQHPGVWDNGSIHGTVVNPFDAGGGRKPRQLFPLSPELVQSGRLFPATAARVFPSVTHPAVARCKLCSRESAHQWVTLRGEEAGHYPIHVEKDLALGDHRQGSISAPWPWAEDRAGPGCAGESWVSIMAKGGALGWVSETTSFFVTVASPIHGLPSKLPPPSFYVQEHEHKHSSCKCLSSQWIKKENCSSVQKHHSQTRKLLWRGIMDNRISGSSPWDCSVLLFIVYTSLVLLRA